MDPIDGGGNVVLESEPELRRGEWLCWLCMSTALSSELTRGPRCSVPGARAIERHIVAFGQAMLDDSSTSVALLTDMLGEELHRRSPTQWSMLE